MLTDVQMKGAGDLPRMHPQILTQLSLLSGPGPFEQWKDPTFREEEGPVQESSRHFLSLYVRRNNRIMKSFVRLLLLFLSTKSILMQLKRLKCTINQKKVLNFVWPYPI